MSTKERIDWGDVEACAKRASANWLRFDSFSYYCEEIDNPADWTIVYTSNRDSTLLSQSNAAAIQKRLAKYQEGDSPDCVEERHSHWAVGYVDGYRLRVYHKGKITDCFREWCQIQDEIDGYPVLDEGDYSEREWEATWNNMTEQGKWISRKEGFILPEGWESALNEKLDELDCNWTESSDDKGGWPEDDLVLRAFESLGYQREVVA